MNRETIYAALFAKLSASAGYVTTSRKLRHWNDVSSEEQPALFVAQRSEVVERPRGLPPKWALTVDVYVYVSTAAQQDSSVIPSQMLNPLIDALEAALAADDLANNACTLGGLVSRCYIDGAIETSEGTLGDQEVAIVPVTIVVPS